VRCNPRGCGVDLGGVLFEEGDGISH
jgi:hypothetical protein